MKLKNIIKKGAYCLGVGILGVSLMGCYKDVKSEELAAHYREDIPDERKQIRKEMFHRLVHDYLNDRYNYKNENGKEPNGKNYLILTKEYSVSLDNDKKKITVTAIQKDFYQTYVYDSKNKTNNYLEVIVEDKVSGSRLKLIDYSVDGDVDEGSLRGDIHFINERDYLRESFEKEFDENLELVIEKIIKPKLEAKKAED